MTPAVEPWIRKAEADFRTMIRESKVIHHSNLDLICYLAQQCIEKLLKGYLTQNDIPFPKTHNLVTLANLAASYVFAEHTSKLKLLTEFASDFRYPNEFATRAEAEEAVQISTFLRSVLLSKLGASELDLFE